jgi:CRISPR-associated protein Csm2
MHCILDGNHQIHNKGEFNMSTPMGKFRQGGGGTSSRNSYGNDRRNNRSTITPSPKINFFSDEKKEILNHAVFETIAEETADKIREKLNSAQLRRFFGELKGYYQQWKNQEKSEEAFKKIFPLIKLMKSRIYYASNPLKKKIPEEFASFLLGGIEQISDSKDFEAFILYFEAVVGFMYGKGLVSK